MTNFIYYFKSISTQYVYCVEENKVTEEGCNNHNNSIHSLSVLKRYVMAEDECFAYNGKTQVKRAGVESHLC